MKKSSVILLIFLTGIVTTHAQKTEPAFLKLTHSHWVDSVMERLTPDERIAQLILIAAYSNRGPEHRQEVLKIIREKKIGGLIFFQGGPGRQASLINEYQSNSQVPLLIAMDAEWGLGM